MPAPLNIMAEIKLVKMVRESDGHEADVHPAEVANFEAGGYKVAEPKKADKPKK